jgi:uncharacterized RmlC-like cupin family protein
MSNAVRRIAPGERTEGFPTAGMTREEAIATDGMWAGLVRSEPGMVSDWHHHGDYETTIYVLSGSIQMEFGPDGAETADAGPGDFVFVGKNAVHRESSTSQEESQFIVVRAGSGQFVFNVEGPEA